MGKILFEDRIREMGTTAVRVFDSALGRMGKDIELIAKAKVPLESTDLFKEIQYQKKGTLKHRVVVDSEYAAFQERGRRFDGSHVVKNYSTPGTGAHYLGAAAKQVVEKGIEYLRQANQLIKIRL